jgi:hypothetical protein
MSKASVTSSLQAFLSPNQKTLNRCSLSGVRVFIDRCQSKHRSNFRGVPKARGNVDGGDRSARYSVPKFVGPDMIFYPNARTLPLSLANLPNYAVDRLSRLNPALAAAGGRQR